MSSRSSSSTSLESSMVFHILPDSESFSEQFGGAISRWVANVLPGDGSARVICPRFDDSWKFPEHLVSSNRAFSLYGRRFRTIRNRAPLAWRLKILRRIFARELSLLAPDDIVWIHNRPESVMAIKPMAKARHAKVVLHLHNSDLINDDLFFTEEFTADLIVFCSGFLEKEARQKHKNLPRSLVIPNGADETRFYPASKVALASYSLATTILFVGRLVPDKGAHVLVQAMKILMQRGINARARIIGSNNFGSKGNSGYIRELKTGAGDSIEFGDYVYGAKLAQAYREADIFCCPSIWNEPFGMVNVEAMASALPVVASEVGGIPDILKDGGGVLVPPDSPSDLANALQVLIMDPCARIKIGQQGLASLNRSYSWQAVRNRYRDVVEQFQATLC